MSSKTPRSKSTLKYAVFSKSPEISRFLNCQSLWKYFLKSDLRFLTRKELDSLQQEPSETEKTTKLLDILDKKPERAVRKFIVCLILEKEHRGHLELTESILKKVPPQKKKNLYQLAQSHITETCKDGKAPPKPVSFMYLDGDLSPSYTLSDTNSPVSTTLIYFTGDLSMEKNCTFRKLDEKLWEFFSTGEYSNLEELVSRILSGDACTPQDWKIIASWFQALIVMHRDHEYSRCIEEILEPTLQACTNSENRTILEGRILQRMAQVYLVMKQKDKAQEYFEMAKEKLMFVGGGYDKANIFCREAKLKSATCITQEERDRTEKLFEIALDNVPADAPYALASRPSLILSKTAFHLHLSFGKAAVGSPPHISSEELTKAKRTLKCLPEEHIMLDIRKCEHSLLKAELTRLEGDFEGAAKEYKRTVQLSLDAKLANITDIAKGRSEYIQRELSNKDTCDKLLEGLG